MNAQPTELSGEVLALCTDWLPIDDDPDRPRMQIATVDADGRPDIRTVLLTSWSAAGFAFHTDRASRKVTQLRDHAEVALDVTWPGFSRQLVIRGVATEQPEAAAADAYARRSPYLQQLAWQNTIEFAQLPHAERVTEWETFRAGHASLDPPSGWIGYVVVPHRVTFWTVGVDTASLRVEFVGDGRGGWNRSLLAG